MPRAEGKFEQKRERWTLAARHLIEAWLPIVRRLLMSAVLLLMAGVAQLSVPLIAEVGVGPNWDEAH